MFFKKKKEKLLASSTKEQYNEALANDFKKNIEKLLISLKLAQEEKDYESVAKYYLEIGKAYKKEGKVSKAIYYLNRFDNLVSGDDNLYTKFEEDDDKAMDWILDLEIEQEPYEKTIQEQVLEKSKDLNVLQKMQWMLLTMSRFSVLFQHISNLPDFEGLGKLDGMITYFAKGLYGELDKEKEWEISDYENYVDEVFSSSLMSDCKQKVEIPNQKSFVVADLESGDDGTYYFIMVFDALQSFIFGELDEEDIDMEFVACGILADYYYRTTDADIKEERKIQEETERIFSDYDFVKEEPSKERFLERIERYKNIMLI